MTQQIDHLLECTKIVLKSKREYLTELVNLKADPLEIEDLVAEIMDLEEAILLRLKFQLEEIYKPFKDSKFILGATSEQFSKAISEALIKFKNLEEELNAT